MNVQKQNLGRNVQKGKERKKSAGSLQGAKGCELASPVNLKIQHGGKEENGLTNQ